MIRRLSRIRGFTNTLQWMPCLSGHCKHLLSLCVGNVLRVHATDTTAIQMNAKHDLCRRFTIFSKEFLNHLNSSFKIMTRNIRGGMTRWALRSRTTESLPPPSSRRTGRAGWGGIFLAGMRTILNSLQFYAWTMVSHGLPEKLQKKCPGRFFLQIAVNQSEKRYVEDWPANFGGFS
jgi:hypothetical protein